MNGLYAHPSLLLTTEWETDVMTESRLVNLDPEMENMVGNLPISD
jgi:hypothetical protein